LALLALAVLPAPQAQAGFNIGAAANYVVLGQFASGDTTAFNNGTINGNIGIGSPRAFSASNGTVNGNIDFSGLTNTSGLTPNPDPTGASGPFTVSGGGMVSGNVTANNSNVTMALNTVNSLSTALGGEPGTSKSVTSGGSINASDGTLDASGNRVFTVTSVNFPNGTFTINGSASDFVVLNIGSSANLHGQILLAGGITADHVLINVFGGNDTNHMGGPTLDVNTNGLSTFGIFLDPNGAMSAVHTDIQGRFFGGDVQNQQIVSGADITAPNTPTQLATVPEPARYALALSGLFTLGVIGVFRRRPAVA
jgi:hypothetical protein